VTIVMLRDSASARGVVDSTVYSSTSTCMCSFRVISSATNSMRRWAHHLLPGQHRQMVMCQQLGGSGGQSLPHIAYGPHPSPTLQASHARLSFVGVRSCVNVGDWWNVAAQWFVRGSCAHDLATQLKGTWKQGSSDIATQRFAAGLARTNTKPSMEYRSQLVHHPYTVDVRAPPAGGSLALLPGIERGEIPTSSSTKATVDGVAHSPKSLHSLPVKVMNDVRCRPSIAVLAWAGTHTSIVLVHAMAGAIP
jgi:hypothetical protein